MQKQRITLNAEKRKVIADVFQTILKIIQNLRKHGKTQKKHTQTTTTSKNKMEVLLENTTHKKMLIQFVL